MMHKNMTMLLVSVVLSLLVCCVTSFSESYPSDLKITVVGGPLMPGMKQHTVIIKADGHGEYSKYIPDPRYPSNDEVFTLTTSQVESLWKTIQEEDFFNLEPQYIDRSVVDGSYVAVTIFANGKSYSVELQNADCKPFLRLLQAINNATPDNKDVVYPMFRENQE